MRNHAVVLLLLSLFAVTLSRDLHKRYDNLEGDAAFLDALVRALEDAKLYHNDQVVQFPPDRKESWWLCGVNPMLGLEKP
ncbi:hypothetical protein ACJMK2_024763 [Sinanodonta woodiana]|uniref:Uncharacterized protein n=1 Tax=Sinanodonta woodiana TaxID=1069815 RepID=A0ABD3XET9_SINWO